MMKILKILLVLILMAFPLGQLTRIPLGMGEVNIYFQDILIGFLVISWLAFHILTKRPFQKNRLAKPIFIFSFLAGLSLLVNFFNFSFREVVVSGLYLLRWIFYAGVYLVVSELVMLRYLDISKWKRGLISVGSAAAVLGLVQYFLYPDLRNLAYLGWDPHKYRVFGTFFDPAFLGLILVLTIILIVDNLLSKIATRRLLLYAFYLLLSTCYLTLALTYSRSSYLAYLVGVGIIAWMKKSARIFMAAVLLGVLTVFLLPRPPGSEGVRLEREESIKGRIKNWQESLIIFKDKPLLGVGFDTYRYVQRNYGFLNQADWQESHAGAGADSSLLFVLATTGILGLAAFSYLTYMTYTTYRKNLVITASLGALFIGSWFTNSLFYSWIMLWLWVLLGITEDKQKIPRLRSE